MRGGSEAGKGARGRRPRRSVTGGGLSGGPKLRASALDIGRQRIAQIAGVCAPRPVNIGGISGEVLHGRLTAEAPGLDGAEGEARGQITLALAVMLTALNDQISVLDQEIATVFPAHPDRHIFASLPRSGTVRAASVLAEIGDCRERFPTDDALAALAGACPSTRQSAKRSQAVLRWSCSKKLRAAVMGFANGSRMSDPWAAALYAAVTGRGCRHPHAIRTLARAWIRIIWRCWQDGTAFDPALGGHHHRPPRPLGPATKGG